MTQADVSRSMSEFYSYPYSQTTISRFEAMNLTYTNMIKLRPMLEEWLLACERALIPSQERDFAVHL